MLAMEELERVLIVTAHPDDLDFGCSGTIATLTAKGTEVAYCICSDGDAGGFDPAIPRNEIGGIRQREQRAAAAAVGVTDVTFLGYPDGGLLPSLDLRRDIARQVRRTRTQVIITQSPERRWERLGASHPDHLAAGEAATCAFYPDAQNPFAHLTLAEEGFEAWKADELWLMATGEVPDAFFVDVTPVIERKFAALGSHGSQFPDGFEIVEKRVREWMGMTARAADLPDGSYAEAFRRVTSF